uniref:NADH dehydrogenase subunit 6 n=1 Tax=Lamellidens marginalis TaxID=644998 RepID=UPI002000D8B6|nr:NADH dehydrogenase subunit 6 [Lamellidens marginalis]QTW91601.1 NADH dehydrogenase subunit 6 [Lamellidens marginalis]
MTLMMAITILIYLLSTMALPMHPLSVGMMILFLAFVTCATIAMTSPWYAYILFFIFIGGMLVMFAYIASLSPNTNFMVNNQLTPIVLTLIILYTAKDLSLQMNNQPYTTTDLSAKLVTETTSYLYTNNYLILIMLAALLLFTMVASVKICKPKNGALRPFK